MLCKRSLGFILGQMISTLLRGVAQLLDKGRHWNPLSLFIDGDLLVTFHSTLKPTGEGPFRVSKVKGHTDQSMVEE